MVTTKKPVVTILICIVLFFCLLIMFELPYEPRFIKAQFNYLFVSALYFVLALLIMYRIWLIEDHHIKKPFIFLGLIVVVFPCLFIVSVALENFYRVKNENGEDSHFKLTKQTNNGNAVIRTYRKPDIGIALLYGFEIAGGRSIHSSTSISSAPTPPYIFVTRTERDISKHLKIVSSQLSP